jgi:hypothetical protein
MRRISSKLTYANVMSTIAVVLAVGGGATAIAMTALPKNSVKSKQIAKGAVTTKKIAKDAVTGDQVKESTLGKVPSAAHADSADTATKAASADTATVASSLAGLNASEVGKTQTVTGQFNFEGLSVNIAGFGRFFIACEMNSPNPNDDEPNFGYSSKMPAGSIESGYYMTAPAPFTSPTTELVAGPVSDAAEARYGEAPAIFIDFTAVTPGGKSVTIRGGASDNMAPSSDCEGTLQATVNG